MQKLRFQIFFISFFSFSILFSQTNLVPNPSFETYTACPNSADQLGYAKPWFKPSTGTPDYFNACASAASYVNVPVTFIGNSPARTGNAMSGIVITEDVLGSLLYREYLSIKLNTTLINSQKYYVTYFVRLADSSRYASNSISVFFKNDSISKSTYDTIKATPQINNPAANFLSSKSAWIQLKGSFIANGTEKYMYIGNFKPDVTNDTLFVTGGGRKQYFNLPYYFVDDVCVSDDSLYSENWSTKIAEIKMNKLNIYPNPVENYLYIENFDLITEFKIHDRMGKEIQITKHNNSFDLSNTPPGFYLLNYKLADDKWYIYKIIKR